MIMVSGRIMAEATSISGPADANAPRVGGVLFDRAADDLAEVGGLPVGPQQQVMGAAHRHQPPGDGGLGLFQACRGPQALPHNGRHHGEHVLHAVMQFFGENGLHLIGDIALFRRQPGFLQQPAQIDIARLQVVIGHGALRSRKRRPDVSHSG